MLEFSKAALQAIPRLFSYRNDVDIYTEDKVADKEFYKALFENLFKGKIKINDVTPLGCKNNVFEAYDNQDKTDKRKRYYIVDGDLDLITGTNRSPEKNLIVLDSYCIENYLIDEVGMTELTYVSNGTTPKEQISKKINFSKWLSYNSIVLCRLFCNLALSKQYETGSKIKNANEFIINHGKQRILEVTAVEGYIEEVKQRIIDKLISNGESTPEDIYEAEIKKLTSKWNGTPSNMLKIVSGKSYLLPLLQFRVNYCIGRGKLLIPKNSIKLYLAKNSSLDNLKYLTTIIK